MILAALKENCAETLANNAFGLLHAGGRVREEAMEGSD
jgi:hypothetical protein